MLWFGVSLSDTFTPVDSSPGDNIMLGSLICVDFGRCAEICLLIGTFASKSTGLKLSFKWGCLALVGTFLGGTRCSLEKV
jgi:hypothetical protein